MGPEEKSDIARQKRFFYYKAVAFFVIQVTAKNLLMGFFFNLFIFPFLLVLTIGLVIFYLISKNKVVLVLLGGLWGIIILFAVGVEVKAIFKRPIRLTKQMIVGEYRIDREHYPGKNADWQYDHFRFKITSTDSIYFYVTDKDSVVDVFKEQLEYVDGPPALWRINNDSVFHVIQHPVSLYRSDNKFYYVFRSDKFGNMFFRKHSASAFLFF